MKSFQEKFQERFQEIQSFLCVGLDPEWEKLPQPFQKEIKLFEFCKEIVDATHSHAVAWKPNIAFFERFGSKGIQEFEKLIEYIRTNYPSIPIIADIKRGDLSNTSKEYAKYYFQTLQVDAITVHPYMGHDSLTPYLELTKGNLFILCLTSNPSATEFQKWQDSNKNYKPGYLYQGVAYLANYMNKEYPGRVGIVVGGTRPYELENLRKEQPNLLFLIPGFGAQGGELRKIIMASGWNSLVNSSRGIHFASQGMDFAKVANKKAEEIHKEMKNYIKVLRSNG